MPDSYMMHPQRDKLHRWTFDKTGNIPTLLTIASMVVMDNADPNTIVVPPESEVAFPVGAKIAIGQDGVGQTSVAPGPGVTIRTPETERLRKQWAKARLVYRGADEWDLDGTLEDAP